MSFLSVVVLALSIQLPAVAGGPSDAPGNVAEKFYAGYVALLKAEKDKETDAWVASSKLVTANFKKFYAKQISPKSGDAVDVDPVIQAQDTPTTPFKAGKPMIQGNKATVILTAKFGVDTGKVIVQMVQVNGAWLVDTVRAAK